MRIITKTWISLLSGAACGFAFYATGAVIWSATDPLGAGKSLLFTIPIGIGGATFFAVAALFALINRGLREPRQVGRVKAAMAKAVQPQRSARRSAAPGPTTTRPAGHPPRRRPSDPSHAAMVDEEIVLAFTG